jgi:tetratricopeptide (TPR) repeat protein
VYSSSTPAFCQEAPSLKVKEGTPFEFFTAGKYPEAIAAYRELLQQRPTDSTLKKGLAASLYHNREYAEAAKVYGDIADKTTKGHEFFENKYNQGNALLKGEKLQEAIEAYEKALQSKPDDPKALHNKEVARALAEEKKREEEKKQQEKKESKKEEQKEENGDNQPENSTSQDESSQPSTASATPSPPLEQKEEEGKDKNKEEQQETTPKSEENENGGKDEGTEDVPPATPSLTEGEKTPTQQQGEGQDKDTGDETESPEEGTPVTETPKATQQSETEKSMPPTEAEMWIESLPDAPLLLRRHRGPPPASGQTW